MNDAPSPRFRRKRWLAALAVAMGLFAGLTYMLVVLYYAPGPLNAEKQVVLPKGSSTHEIAEILSDNGVVGSEPLFYLYAAWGHLHHQNMKAGEYRIHAGASPREIFLLLWEGRTVIRQVTIPEGYSVKDIRKRLESAEGLEGAFPNDVKDGELLPDTYNYSWGDTRADIVTRMRTAMQTAMRELWAKRQPGLPFENQTQALTLASIVEKETALREERGRVAAVYINRLRQGMKLQADPTVIYGLTGGDALSHALTLNELTSTSPYNTYVIEGLPPGPIANPGRASIEAVLDPPVTDELFFVADGSGGHRFASTIEQHEKNVALYRTWQTLRRTH